MSLEKIKVAVTLLFSYIRSFVYFKRHLMQSSIKKKIRENNWAARNWVGPWTSEIGSMR